MKKKASAAGRNKNPNAGLRISPEDKELFTRAYKAAKMDSMNQWMRWVLRKAAEETLSSEGKR